MLIAIVALEDIGVVVYADDVLLLAPTKGNMLSEYLILSTLTIELDWP